MENRVHSRLSTQLMFQALHAGYTRGIHIQQVNISGKGAPGKIDDTSKNSCASESKEKDPSLYGQFFFQLPEI